MKKYRLPIFFGAFLILGISNYMRLSEGYEVRAVQVVQLIGIGFLAGMLVMQLINIYKEQNQSKS